MVETNSKRHPELPKPYNTLNTLENNNDQKPIGLQGKEKPHTALPLLVS